VGGKLAVNGGLGVAGSGAGAGTGGDAGGDAGGGWGGGTTRDGAGGVGAAGAGGATGGGSATGVERSAGAEMGGGAGVTLAASSTTGAAGLDAPGMGRAHGGTCGPSALHPYRARISVANARIFIVRPGPRGA